MATVRRIVTDHSADGKAIIGSDDILKPTNPLDPDGGPPSGIIPGFVNVFRTTGPPASAQGAWDDPYGKMMGLVGREGVVCRIVDFPPVSPDQLDEHNIMHRTLSVDFGVVLKGEIELVLDDGVRTLMKGGDIAVQRGTIHHWNNESGETCRMLFVLVPADPIMVETTGKILEPTSMKHIESEKHA